jgi:hypothetical protein
VVPLLNDIDVLAAAIRERRAILFAGAGLSMVVGLPSWQSLIDHLAAELGLDADQVLVPGIDYQVLAEHYRIVRGSIGPLRSWMDREWKVTPERVRESRIHELVVALDFPLIYTTNYDRNLEMAFELHGRPFVKIANAADLTKISGEGTQIVKFHGDFDDDETLVLTETDYFSRLSFDSPLDVKFRADAMGRTVLFVGYSMRDLNIRMLLHRIWETWAGSRYEAHRPRSYIFMHRANPVQQAVLARWGITLLTGSSEEPEAALTEFLQELKERAEREASASGPSGIAAAQAMGNA